MYEPHDLGAEYLGKLGVELAARGVQCELITSGCAPCSRLEIPRLGGWDDVAFEDNILASQSRMGNGGSGGRGFSRSRSLLTSQAWRIT